MENNLPSDSQIVQCTVKQLKLSKDAIKRIFKLWYLRLYLENIQESTQKVQTFTKADQQTSPKA